MMPPKDSKRPITATEANTFTARETHGRALRPDNRLIAHSEDVKWRSLYAAIFEEAPFQATELAIHHPSLIYHLSRPTEVIRKIEGARREVATIGPRGITITPGEVTTRWQHRGHPEILQVYVRQSVYQAAVHEMYGCDASAATIVPRLGALDPLAPSNSVWQSRRPCGMAQPRTDCIPILWRR